MTNTDLMLLRNKKVKLILRGGLDSTECNYGEIVTMVFKVANIINPT